MYIIRGKNGTKSLKRAWYRPVVDRARNVLIGDDLVGHAHAEIVLGGQRIQVHHHTRT